MVLGMQMFVSLLVKNVTNVGKNNTHNTQI